MLRILLNISRRDFHSGHEELISLIVADDLPLDPSSGSLHPNHMRSWLLLLDASTNLADHIRARLVSKLLELYRDCADRNAVKKLSELKDSHGRTAISLTDKQTKAVLSESIYFCSRYGLDLSQQPLYASDTTVVMVASDHQASDEYHRMYAELVSEEDGEASIDAVCNCLRSMGLHTETGDAVAQVGRSE